MQRTQKWVEEAWRAGTRDAACSATPPPSCVVIHLFDRRPSFSISPHLRECTKLQTLWCRFQLRTECCGKLLTVMPPFLPRKRVSSTPPPSTTHRQAKKPRLSQASDNQGQKTQNIHRIRATSDGGSDSESSLSDVDSEEFEDIPSISNTIPTPDEDDDEEVEWEDAAPNEEASQPKQTPVIRDIQLTLPNDSEGDPVYGTAARASTGRKGPTRREKEARVLTHCMHVQFLLYHNAIRNNWICDRQVQRILVEQLPTQIKREVEKWRVASGSKSRAADGVDVPAQPQPGRKAKVKWSEERLERDWGKPSQRVEEGRPNLSNGDPLIHLMKVLSAYWKKRFAITAPGLRKRGYGTKLALKQEIASLRNDEHDPAKHGERIVSLQDFRELAKKCQGSRDLGAQFFTALLRGLGVEARLVASLQPSGFGWTKAEQLILRTPQSAIKLESRDKSDTDEGEVLADSKQKAKMKTRAHRLPKSRQARGDRDSPIDLDSETELGSHLTDEGPIPPTTTSLPKQRRPRYDRDLVFPIYWTEAVSPITHRILPVSPLVLQHPVASTPEVLSAFEPRGVKAERGKQVMAYVVAYSSDGTAKDVTVRYLRKHIWPGRTKGFRMPIEKIPVYNKYGKVSKYEEFDWFKFAMRGYVRSYQMRTAVDDIEDSTDLVPAQPEKKDPEELGDTLQSLKTSKDFVLERFLKREEALRRGAKADRTFVSGKAPNIKEEFVYRRADVERCLTAESWHKEGRRPREGENPIKLVPVRAVTLTRKREAEEHERQTGQKQMQGLYSWDQTEYIIPPPIKNGVIPKNSYGNMDCFVPSMVPKGAVHVPLRGTVRICRKLDIDYAEAVTGFEFGNKRAVPVCTGVVVAAENEQKLIEAWEAWNEEQRKKEEGKVEKICLDLWRKMLVGLRIRERVVGDYGDEVAEVTGLQRDGTLDQPIDVDEHGSMTRDDLETLGGGFLLSHDEDEPEGGDLIMDGHHNEPRRTQFRPRKSAEQYPTPSSLPAVKSTTKSAANVRHTAVESSDLSDLTSSFGDMESEEDITQSGPVPSSGRRRQGKHRPPGRTASAYNKSQSRSPADTETDPSMSAESQFDDDSDEEEEAQEYIPSSHRRRAVQPPTEPSKTPPRASKRFPKGGKTSPPPTGSSKLTPRRQKGRVARGRLPLTSPYF